MKRIWAGISPAHFFLLPLQAGHYDQVFSAGPLKHLEGYVADVEELTAMLKSEVLERVKCEIWLEADEDIDYAVQADNIQSQLPVEPKSEKADEEDVCAQLNKGLDELVDTLYAISSALDRHRSDEDYSSHGDRYLSHSSRHTQVPVPLTTQPEEGSLQAAGLPSVVP